jgi:hypothetical protein
MCVLVRVCVNSRFLLTFCCACVRRGVARRRGPGVRGYPFVIALFCSIVLSFLSAARFAKTLKVWPMGLLMVASCKSFFPTKFLHDSHRSVTCVSSKCLACQSCTPRSTPCVHRSPSPASRIQHCCNHFPAPHDPSKSRPSPECPSITQLP